MENKITTETGGTTIQKAVNLNRLSSNILIRIAAFILYLAGIAAIFYLIFAYFVSQTVNTIDSFGLGLSYLCLALFLVYLAVENFLTHRLKKIPIGALSQIKEKVSKKEVANIFSVFSFDLAKATSLLFSSKTIEKIALKELGQNLLQAGDMAFIVLRLGLKPVDIVNSLEATPLTADILLAAVDNAIADNHNDVRSGDLFLAIYQASAGLKNYLHNFQVNDVDIKSLIDWQNKVVSEEESRRGLFNANNFRFTGGIGKEWSFGYTVFLRQFSTDLTEAIESYGLGIDVIGRDQEIKQIEDALSRGAGANVILVGNAGIGKHTTVLGFAKKVIDGDVPRGISHNDILQIDTEALIAGVHSEGDIIQRFSTCLSEAAGAGNIIVLIENIDNLFSAKGIGTADLTAILSPYLESSAMHIIGTSEVGPYNEYIIANTALANHFTRVSIEEPQGDNLIKILEDTAPTIEARTGSIVTFEAIKAAVKAAAKFMVNLTEPERSITLLEGAVTRTTTERGKTIIIDADVADYIAEKFELPAAQAGEKEKAKLLDLEKIMHESVIGQDEAIKALAGAMRRSRAQVTDSPKPIGSFLFLGPTGVGKTETAKALARAYFDNANNMIRFDMSEYQTKADIYRLIGTKDETGNLTTYVMEKPFSLLLFDEIEKADPDILNLFLQILDEGLLTDGRGQKVSFSNTIIIATSNAGSDIISETLGQNANYDQLKNTLSQYLIEQHLFKPELLNRFTGVVAFSPLDQGMIAEVAKLLIKNLQATVLKNQDIKIEVAPDAIDYLAKIGFDPKMGARPMQRTISDKVENMIAEKILRNEIKKGDSLTITREMVE